MICKYHGTCEHKRIDGSCGYSDPTRCSWNYQPQRERQYLETGMVWCPYCGTSGLVAGSVFVDGGIVKRQITCKSCNKIWNDIYDVVGIEERI